MKIRLDIISCICIVFVILAVVYIVMEKENRQQEECNLLGGKVIYNMSCLGNIYTMWGDDCKNNIYCNLSNGEKIDLRS